MAKKINDTILSRLAGRLERRGFNNVSGLATAADYALLQSCLSDIGYRSQAAMDFSAGPRIAAPDYKALGITRKAGNPTEDDIQRYKDITAGAELTEDGFVCPVLLTDNDLLPDRYAAFSFRAIVELCSRYLGRANDTNHSLDVSSASGRLIDVFAGNDPNTEMHKDYPMTSLKTLDLGNEFEGQYTALCGLMAFPAESTATINKIKTGLIQDVSVMIRPENITCSLCLQPMESFFVFSYCEKCGLPGDKNDDGESLVSIWARCSDARTFGHVSDGAARRARYVLDFEANV